MKRWIAKCSRKKIVSIACMLSLLLALIPFSSLVHAEPAPEILDPNLEQITFSDFNISDDTYNYNNGDVSKAGQYKDTSNGQLKSLSGKVFSGNITFSEMPASLYVGGLNDAWYGLSINSLQHDSRRDVLTLKVGGEVYTLTPEVAGVTLIDSEFNLKLSYQEVDVDEDGTNDTLKLGVWFNNRLYNNKYIEIDTYTVESYKGNGDYKDYLTGRIYLVARHSMASLKVASDIETELDPTLERLSFENFNIPDGTYTYNNGDVSKAGQYKDPRTGQLGSLSGKVFSGDVTFSKKPATLYFGGLYDAWYGLSLGSGKNDSRADVLTLKVAGAVYTLTPEGARATLVEESVNLKLSYQELDKDNDGTNDTLQLGVWFNDRLYQNKYFEITTYQPQYANQQTGSYTDYLQGRLYIVSGHVDGSLVVVSDRDKVLDSSLERISFVDFGIDDGTYGYKNGDVAKSGYYKDPETKDVGSLSGKVISADVLFSDLPTKLYVGGKYDAWYGLSIASRQDGDRADVLTLKVGGKVYTFTPEVAKATLVGKSVNLKLSYQEVDKDDDGTNDTLQLGVWFNDKLYNNKYIEVTTYDPKTTTQQTGNYTDYLVARIYIVPEMDGATFTVVSDEEKTLDPTLEKITLADFNIADGTYSYNNGDVAKSGQYKDPETKDVASLAGKVLSTDVTFSELPAGLYIGGLYDAWYGMTLTSRLNENDTDALTLKVAGQEYLMTPEVAGTTLVGQSFNLKLSYQEADKDGDGTNDTLKLGVWFNDKLYNNRYIEVTTYTPKDSQQQTGNYTDYLTGRIYIVPRMSGATLTVVSDVDKVLDASLEKITFTDFDIADGTYKYNGGEVSKSGTYKGTFSGKVLQGDVTFTESSAYMYVGGYPDAWYGLSLASGQNVKDKDALTLKVGGQTLTLTPEVAKTTLVGKSVNLKLSYQEVDTDADSKNDTLQLGVWFNDKLYNNKYIYVSTYEHPSQNLGVRDYTDYLSGSMYIVPTTDNATLTVVSDGEKTLDPTLEKITLTDFNIADGTYGYNNGDVAKSGYYKDPETKDVANLAGKVLSTDVTFSELPAGLYIGGLYDAWYGMTLTSRLNENDPDALTLKVAGKEYLMTPEVAGTTLVGQSFNLKLSYQEADKDGDGTNDTLKLGVWFNDKLYNNRYIEVTTYTPKDSQQQTGNYTDYLTGRIYIVPRMSGAALTVVSDVDKVLDASLEKITFTDFNIADGTYKYNGGDVSKNGTYKNTLSGKIIRGDVKFSESPSFLYVGGYPDAWYGLSLASGQNDKDPDALTLKVAGKEYTLTPEVAKATLVGESVNLKLSYQEVDSDADGKNDSLQIGVWFNDKLYNNKYITVTTYEHSTQGTRDYKDYLQGSIYIVAAEQDSTFTVASYQEKVLDPTLENITLRDFRIEDGTYTYKNGDVAAKGAYLDRATNDVGSLSGKVVSADVTFSNLPTRLYIGGKYDAWYGLSIASRQNDNRADVLTLKVAGKTYTLTPEVAEATLVGETINLKLSYQEIDKNGDGTNDALQLGVWINGKLYNNEYIEVTTYEVKTPKQQTGSYTDYLVGRIYIVPEMEGAFMTVASDIEFIPETLDQTLEEISFGDFGFFDGTYNKADKYWMELGKYSETLAGKVFNGYVTFSDKRSDIWIGGVEDAWKGIGLMAYSKNFIEFRYDGKSEYLTSQIAGTDLVGEEFNLKISYQLVPKEGDESKKVLQLGIWFNDTLYDNRYFYIEDYEKYLGGLMGIYTAEEGSYVTIRSAEGLALKYAPGSKDESVPYVGDDTNYVVYIALMCVAFVGITFSSSRRKRSYPS